MRSKRLLDGHGVAQNCVVASQTKPEIHAPWRLCERSGTRPCSSHVRGRLGRPASARAHDTSARMSDRVWDSACRPSSSVFTSRSSVVSAVMLTSTSPTAPLSTRLPVKRVRAKEPAVQEEADQEKSRHNPCSFRHSDLASLPLLHYETCRRCVITLRLCYVRTSASLAIND